ncbi:MAG: acetyl-CoA C-acyltransferase, partial [Bacteroidetes bacterium]|nr:acetyl-CoA C-acyltransferase [Bacteroidota bacterium]
MPDVYIVDAVRTPIGSFGGALKDHSAVDLAAHVMAASIERSGAPAEALDMVIFGNILRAGQGQLVTRQAARKAGVPDSVDGFTVDMVCSSGMLSLMQAATMIKAG